MSCDRGDGFNVDLKSLDTKAHTPTGRREISLTTTDFLLNIHSQDVHQCFRFR